MASFNTGVHLDEVMGESDKSLHVVVRNKDGAAAPYHISKKLAEWKQTDGRLTLFVQTWYAKTIGLAQKEAA